MDIKGFATELNTRVNCDFDSVVIVDSGSVKGTGKSTFSIALQMECCKLINYPYSFDLIIFNPTDEKIIDLVKNLPRGVAILIDEASKVAYKRDYQKEYQKNLIKFINICRKFGKILIINNPDFWDLDKDLRNLADFRVIIVKRGKAHVKGKSPNPDLKDKWLRDESIKKIEQFLGTGAGAVTKVSKAQHGITKTPNFLYEIPVPPLPAEVYEEYVELSKKEEVKSFQEDEVRKVAREKLMAYLLWKFYGNDCKTARAINKLYLSLEGVDKLGNNLISHDTVKIFREWVELRSTTAKDLK